ncbi:Inner membrane protein YjdF [Polystyrenella longa]|uniref:Inner membrane protein YjdF n=1 Tax=Polystyrenella longa TaxID=2528007 RepID=A0A518CRY7_9PLAN|nr:DUF2238 domain-containing protein [Polystyrenella longa]QDU81978.1 Inner membrane protein YjdF [Polystyrenella longa]
MEVQHSKVKSSRWTRRCRWATVVLFFLMWIVLSFDVPFPEFYVLQHIPTVGAWIVIFILMRYRLLKEVDLYAIIAFLVLHLIGARYIYSCVPYDEWTESLFGVSLSETFHWERNHYDRLVHLLYGTLFSLPAWHLLDRYLTKSNGILILLTVQAILATSALYELAEWSLTMVAAPEAAESYNGQQGDIWDAHQDMALALLGSLISCFVLLLISRHTKASQSD